MAIEFSHMLIFLEIASIKLSSAPLTPSTYNLKLAKTTWSGGKRSTVTTKSVTLLRNLPLNKGL